MESTTKKFSFKLVCLVYLSLALTLTFYHTRTIERVFWKERQKFHVGIMASAHYSPYQYRIVAPYLAEAGGRVIEKIFSLDSDKNKWFAREAVYVLERFISTFLLLIIFHKYLETWLSPELSFSGAALFACFQLYTFRQYYYQPDYPIALFLLALAALLIVRNKTWELYPLIFIGSFTRETLGIIVPMYLAQNYPGKKSFIHSIGLFLTWLAVQVALRGVFGMRTNMAGGYFPNTPMEQLANIDWPIFLYALFWIVPLIRFRQLPQFLRYSAVLVGIPLLVANFLFAEFEEPRQFLDFGLFLIPATLIALFGYKNKEAPPEETMTVGANAELDLIEKPAE
jgi:hypothetical protein